MDRLVYLSDSGVVVYPDVYQKLEIINNVVAVAQLFGVPEPRVAILAAMGLAIGFLLDRLMFTIQSLFTFTNHR